MGTELKGKIALVTGAGRGLGEAICMALGEAGMTVVAADIRQPLVEGVVERLSKADGDGKTGGHGVPSQHMALVMDVSDETQVQDAIRRVVEKYGHLDVLINSAGTDKTVSVEELSVADWDCVIDVNLRGPFVTSKFAFPYMREQGGGHIVNIVSTGGKRAWPNASAYNASKWGLLGFTYALHTEGRLHGIKVTAVVPGGMRTPFLLDRFPDIDVNNLQDPRNVADTVRYILTLPAETVIPEVMVLPMRETSWP
jgi:NAD(P)-dependent dehydrogenase (short-subunit alcohol dehydrogenase family)